MLKTSMHFCIFYLFISLTNYVLASEKDLLQITCEQESGQLMNQWQCPHSGEIRKGQFCVVKNQNGQNLVFNGCTGSFSDMGDFFFPACVQHDFCYHNEPGHSGKSKKQCDEQFLKNMRTLCDTQGFNSKLCHGQAWSFYKAVSHFGDASWNCSKEKAEYPIVVSF